MTPRELKQLQHRLLHRQFHLRRELVSLEQAAETAFQADDFSRWGVPFDVADVVAASGQERAVLLADPAEEELFHVEMALRHLYEDPRSFGVCEACGAEIPLERLDRVPDARRCVGCEQGPG